ncbi:MAG: response regulator [Polyangiaceae bacterium]
MDEIGGKTAVVSDAERGAPFGIYISAVEDTAAVVSAAVKKRGSCASETILFVDDEPAIRRVVVRTLTKLGYVVLQAEDGVAALEVVHGHAGPIDLLVTDVVMPRMDGCELAKALLARYSELRVLYTSGFTDDPIMRDGAEVAFLAKPYDLTSLRQKVRDVLDHSP